MTWQLFSFLFRLSSSGMRLLKKWTALVMTTANMYAGRGWLLRPEYETNKGTKQAWWSRSSVSVSVE